MTQLHIDWTACHGRGLCAELLPELLDTDPWGYPVPRNQGRDLTVPAELHGDAVTATKLCPRLALRLR
jgi:ferredoxin